MDPKADGQETICITFEQLRQAVWQMGETGCIGTDGISITPFAEILWDELVIRQ